MSDPMITIGISCWEEIMAVVHMSLDLSYLDMCINWTINKEIWIVKFEKQSERYSFSLLKPA